MREERERGVRKEKERRGMKKRRDKRDREERGELEIEEDKEEKPNRKLYMNENISNFHSCTIAGSVFLLCPEKNKNPSINLSL